MSDELSKLFIYAVSQFEKVEQCAVLAKNYKCVLPGTKGFMFAVIQSHFLVQAMIFFLSSVCLVQIIRVYPGKKLIPCFLEDGASMLFSMSLWNLAGKNTSRNGEKCLLLYEILFSFG